MSVSNNNSNVAYGLSQSLLNVFPAPIIAERDPNANDKAQLGTIWINKPDNTGFLLTSVVNNVANWEGFSGSGVFGSLTVNGPTSLTGPISMNQSGNSTINIGANVNYSGIVSIGGTGDVFVGPFSNGGVFLGATSTTNTTINGGQINVGTAPSDGDITIGNNTDPITMSGDIAVTGGITTTTDVVSGTGFTATIGDIVASNGDIISAAGNVNCVSINLAGPIQIITGSGAPGNGLALHVGDFYINRTAATAATRLYVATGVGAWTNVTCAA